MSSQTKVEKVFKVGPRSFSTEEKAQQYLKEQEKQKTENQNGNKRKIRLQIRFSQEEIDYIENIGEERGIQNKSEIVRTLFNMSRIILQSKELNVVFAKHAAKVGKEIRKE